jgi:hypothetical protein
MSSSQKVAARRRRQPPHSPAAIVLNFAAPAVVLLAIARTVGSLTHSSEMFYLTTMIISVATLVAVRIMRTQVRRADKAAEEARAAKMSKRSPKQKSAKPAASADARTFPEWTPERVRMWRVFVAGLPCITIALFHYAWQAFGF